MRGTARFLGLFAAAMLVAVGCSSEPSGDAAAPEPVVDLAKLDVGPYPRVAREITTTPSWALARYLEGMRLSSVLPLPVEIDPQFVVPQPGSRAFPRPGENLAKTFRDTFDEDTKGLVAGFFTGARSHEDPSISQELSVHAMLFESVGAAQSAAVALHRRGHGPDVVAEPIKSTRHPDALMLWRDDEQRVTGWMATGRFVVKVTSRSEENVELKISDQAAVLPIADKALTVTAERLAAHTPTPVDRLQSIPVDPDKMLARTLPIGRETGADPVFPVVRDGHGALHGALDFANTRRGYEQAGVDRVSEDKSTVYRTRDAAGARQLLVESGHDKFLRTVQTPAGLAAATCYESLRPKTVSRYYCTVSHDRYAAVVSSNQIADAQQAISAQYAILVSTR
ncbi:hypothetical protein [Nocardia sp. NPDC058666]|uniref:DUF7373 family lipoprotein n=1 Tax=unclassified Nocardia TaxID=2637762 RepID=UPI003659E207